MSGFNGLVPWLRPHANALYRLADSYGDNPRINSVFRSVREQRTLYEKYLRGESSLPAAPPGRSLHNYGQAFDMTVNTPEAQEWLGRVWESWGGRWGGRFNDVPNFDTGATIQ